MGCGRNEDVGDDRRPSHDNCICEVVRAIRRIQDIRDDRECDDCNTDCFLTPLGSLVSPSRQRSNTRVFMLLTDDGDPFKAMFNNRRRENDMLTADELENERNRMSCFSVFFRVQNVFDNCCATLQVLEPLDRRGRRVDLFRNGKLDLDAICEVERFDATGSCVTVDLKCFCGIQCVKDVFIDCDEF
jgi:Spore coat protein Z